MKKLSIILIIIFMQSIIIGCNSHEIQNQYSEGMITTDGDYTDWESIDLQYIEELNLVMGSLNDTENLFVMFRFTDHKLARKIEMMGVTFWMAEKGNREKKFGVKYTGSVDLHVNSTSELRSSERMPSQIKERIEKFRGDLPAPGKIMVIKNGEEIEMAENNKQGPSAGSTNHNGIYCYEFKMPIPISIKLGDEISLCMELGGANPEYLSTMREQRGAGGRSGGMMDGRGTGGGRGMGRGMRGKGGGDRSQAVKEFEKKEIWMKIVLKEAQ